MKKNRRIGKPFFAAATLTALMLVPIPSAYAASDPPAGKSASPASDAGAAQRALDLEHNMMQSDGVNHPRETVKQRAGKSAAPKPVPKAKTQRDLDLEHDMNQTDGAKHPREKVSDKPVAVAGSKASTARKKTQTDLDHEHERLQSDGTYHPREVLKK